MKKLYTQYRRRFLLWAMDTRLYSYLLAEVIPYIRFTTYYSKFPGWKYHRMYATLQPGDIVLSTDTKKLTAMLVPGSWSHAGVCVSKDGVFEIAEMTHKGYTESTFSDFCYESTRVCIIRGKYFDKDYTRLFIEETLSYVGTPYDQKFELGIGALSCSELIYVADTEKRLGASLEDIAGLGRPYISPTGIYFADVEAVSDSDAIHGIMSG